MLGGCRCGVWPASVGCRVDAVASRRLDPSEFAEDVCVEPRTFRRFEGPDPPVSVVVWRRDGWLRCRSSPIEYRRLLCAHDASNPSSGFPWDWAPSGPPKKRTHGTGVDHRARPVDLLGALQMFQQNARDCLPHACVLPSVQATPTSHPAAAPNFMLQVFPGTAGPQHEENPGQHRDG